MHKTLKMLFLSQIIVAFMVFAYTISTLHAAEELIPENPEGTAATNDDDELPPENSEETATTNNEGTIPENDIKDEKKYARQASLNRGRRVYEHQSKWRQMKQLYLRQVKRLKELKYPFAPP
ncbi:MAG: hypothetical protein JETT_3570 [Candidatus Jettenia ecosi]|uniref:Uncharacterized protein n=1 Tax=Candidatus Jettenia ecosi TaxID=2494326 RepID=A0A533Q6J6_9BACT|nr:MAG: hypothetical protein JETT_3570 [Candidatus Jettenia ecosi]